MLCKHHLMWLTYFLASRRDVTGMMLQIVYNIYIYNTGNHPKWLIIYIYYISRYDMKYIYMCDISSNSLYIYI